MGALVYFLVVPGDFDPTAARFAAAAKAQLHIGSGRVPEVMAVQVLFSAVLAPFFNMLLAIGEEAGWRGLLYSALGERMPKVRAAVLSGVAWACGSAAVGMASAGQRPWGSLGAYRPCCWRYGCL